MTKENDYDIVIAGGGLVGTALAVALKKCAFRVGLIESHPVSLHPQALEDMRSLALSSGSQQILDTLGIWQNIEAYATPIENIHVSEARRFGSTLLESQLLDLPPFGYVVPLPFLYQALQESLRDTQSITLMQPASVKEVKKEDNGWELTLEIDKNIRKISTTLLIAADGGHSFIRESLGIIAKKTACRQTAIVTSARISSPHNNTAYERFVPQGVLALLPLLNQRMGIVWTVSNEYVDALREKLLENTQTAMGYRLGTFSELGKINVHPLEEITAEVQTLPGLFLLGNAAHVLHPVAAQGFNLSLRDVFALSQLLSQDKDLESEQIKIKLEQNYLKAREEDQQETKQFTRRLTTWFLPKFLPLSLLRSIGLGVFDLFPSQKRKFCLKRMKRIIL